MTVTCTYNGIKLENYCKEPIEGTTARFQCADFFEDVSLENHPVHFCKNGRWNHNVPECVPICGQKNVPDPTLIVGGRNATKSEFPWQVALYNASSKDLLCGGTLLNQRIVVTAAHCVTNYKGEPYSNQIYMVAVGKYYRRYDHPEDLKHAQFSPVDKIYVPRQYKADTQNYFGDIAILVTKKTFQLSARVLPVCVDWSLKHRDILLDYTRKADTFVSGWGFIVENKNPSEALKALQVPLVSEELCSRNLPEEHTKYLTDDKLCAGSLEAGEAICKGDGGAGLVTRLGSRFYIIGVVSLSLNSPGTGEGCDIHQYALYTKVHYYIDRFLLEKEAEFRPTFENVDCEDDPNNCTNAVSPTPATVTKSPFTAAPLNGCVLPQHPEFGNWVVVGSAPNILSPGMRVAPGTTLKVSCKQNYKYTGQYGVFCEDEKWTSNIGHCSKMCPPRVSTTNMRVTCIYTNRETENCTDAVEGTLAKYKCAPYYEDPSLARKSIHLCQNGEWDQQEPDCRPVCGQKTVDATKLIINGTNATRGEYPWQVALYTTHDKLLICGGSLLSQKIILTAAHCIADDRRNLKSKESFIVAVGTYYRQFNDSRDINHSQFSELQAMFVANEYQGYIQNFVGDIAILVTKKKFVLSREVQPVCLDSSQSYNHAENEYGYVTGWGFTAENSKPSVVLKELKVPTITLSQCRRNLPDDFEKYLTHDKLCGGYLDKEASVCLGDSGGGLVFKHNGRFYITGIVSVSPTSPIAVGGCDSHKYGFYTKVSNYINFFILPKLVEFKT